MSFGGERQVADPVLAPKGFLGNNAVMGGKAPISIAGTGVSS